MKHTISLVFSAIALMVAFAVVPSVSSAQPSPASTPVPMQKPDFSSMMFLAGTWTCTQMLRGKSRPDTSTTTVGMDGMWMVSQDSAPPFDQYRTVTINGTNYLTYDPTIKQWVGIGVDSGGGYGTESSPGWQGNTMTSTGKGLDGTTFTDVLTKVSDTKTIDQNTATDPQGKTTKATITCMKTAS
ncbi:MAG: hypothetical protein WAK16_07120 [Candidatus Cybelea sp.]|jgi:hypothetical protein